MATVIPDLPSADKGKPEINPFALALVYAPVGVSAIQQRDLEHCAMRLHRVSRRIAAGENNLIYLYVEAGFFLLKAHAAHRSATVAERSLTTGKFTHDERNFGLWLARQPEESRIPQRTAERYMQGARNCGLTAESSPLALQAIYQRKQLANQTLTALCRKPTDKTDGHAQLHDVTPEEADAERVAEIKKFWTDWGEHTIDRGLNEQDWAAVMSQDEIAALCDIAHDLHARLKSALRKPKPVPALPAIKGGKA